MDFLYDFKQANQDRLEDAGVKVYRKDQTAPRFARPARKNKKQARGTVATLLSSILGR